MPRVVALPTEAATMASVIDARASLTTSMAKAILLVIVQDSFPAHCVVNQGIFSLNADQETAKMEQEVEMGQAQLQDLTLGTQTMDNQSLRMLPGLQIHRKRREHIHLLQIIMMHIMRGNTKRMGRFHGVVEPLEQVK